MKLKKILLVGLLIFIIGFSGCTNEEEENIKVYIKTGYDDGYFQVLTDLIANGTIAGSVIADTEGCWTGIVMGGSNKLTMRTLIRFDLEGWNGENLSLNIKVDSIFGTPGILKIYLVSDFGSLSTDDPNNPVDMTSYWNLIDGATELGSFTPQQGEWNKISFSGSAVTGGTDYLSLVIALSNESIADGNAVIFSNYESNNSAFIEWVTQS